MSRGRDRDRNPTLDDIDGCTAKALISFVKDGELARRDGPLRHFESDH